MQPAPGRIFQPTPLNCHSLEDVVRFREAFSKQNCRIDILIHEPGQPTTIRPTRGNSLAQNDPRNANHLSPLLLTILLEGHLASDARIVFPISSLHYLADLSHLWRSPLAPGPWAKIIRLAFNLVAKVLRWITQTLLLIECFVPYTWSWVKLFAEANGRKLLAARYIRQRWVRDPAIPPYIWSPMPSHVKNMLVLTYDCGLPASALRPLTTRQSIEAIVRALCHPVQLLSRLVTFLHEPLLSLFVRYHRLFMSEAGKGSCESSIAALAYLLTTPAVQLRASGQPSTEASHWHRRKYIKTLADDLLDRTAVVSEYETMMREVALRATAGVHGPINIPWGA